VEDHGALDGPRAVTLHLDLNKLNQSILINKFLNYIIHNSLRLTISLAVATIIPTNQSTSTPRSVVYKMCLVPDLQANRREKSLKNTCAVARPCSVCTQTVSEPQRSCPVFGLILVIQARLALRLSSCSLAIFSLHSALWPLTKNLIPCIKCL
jgi:hypothetical protein